MSNYDEVLKMFNREIKKYQSEIDNLKKEIDDIKRENKALKKYIDSLQEIINGEIPKFQFILSENRYKLFERKINMKRQIVNYTENTPIEALLNVDKEGNTTARNLYEFLKLAKGQFSRWAKSNIVNNPYAEENKDWIGFDIDVEGNIVKDYKLTSDFAKKLSMISNSERGE